MTDSGEKLPILFYDGTCGFCHGTVKFVARIDRKHVVFFAPLQGLTARSALDPETRANLDTVVLVDEQATWKRSDAVLRLVGRMGGAWRLAVILLWIPRWIRDGIYDQVARNRYRWFGKFDACEIPSVEQRKKMLP